MHCRKAIIRVMDLAPNRTSSISVGVFCMTQESRHTEATHSHINPEWRDLFRLLRIMADKKPLESLEKRESLKFAIKGISGYHG